MEEVVYRISANEYFACQLLTFLALKKVKFQSSEVFMFCLSRRPAYQAEKRLDC